MSNSIPTRKQTPQSCKHRYMPSLEALEDRLVPVVFGVNPGDQFAHLPMKSRIEAEFPQIANPATSDFEKTNLLRQWAYQNIDMAGNRELKLDADPSINFYKSSAAQIFKLFDQDRGGVNCGGSAYFLQEVFRIYGYEATRFDGGDKSVPNTHAATLVKITHNGSQRIILQDPLLNATVVDTSGAPVAISDMLRQLKRGDNSNIIVQVGDIIGRDYLSINPPSWMKDSPTFTQVRAGLWKIKTADSWNTYADWWDSLSLNEKGYGENVLSLFLMPINSWSQGKTADDLIRNTAEDLLRPAYNGPAILGPDSQVSVYFTNGQIQTMLQPFGPRFHGDINLARGDVNGDGVLDVIAAPGSGGGPHVLVFDGFSGKTLHSFMAYNPAFTGGVNVASGDVNGDGLDDIITAPSSGGGPHVRVFDAADHELTWEFYAYNPAFTGGVNVAAGDVNGDGLDDVITAPNSGGGPHVRVFDAVNHNVIWEFFAYRPTYTGGVNVAAGDINGDGLDDIITAPVAGGAHVRVFDSASRNLHTEFLAHPPSVLGETRVHSHDINHDNIDDYFIRTTNRPARILDGNDMVLLWEDLS